MRNYDERFAQALALTESRLKRIRPFSAAPAWLPAGPCTLPTLRGARSTSVSSGLPTLAADQPRAPRASPRSPILTVLCKLRVSFVGGFCDYAREREEKTHSIGFLAYMHIFK